MLNVLLRNLSFTPRLLFNTLISVQFILVPERVYDYNENGRIGMFNIIYLFFRLLSSLRLSSEETDRQLITMVHVTHTTLFISNLPMFGLPKGCHTYFLTTTSRTETYLANPKKLVQPLPCLVDSVNLPHELFFFLLFKMSP